MQPADSRLIWPADLDGSGVFVGRGWRALLVLLRVSLASLMGPRFGQCDGTTGLGCQCWWLDDGWRCGVSQCVDSGGSGGGGSDVEAAFLAALVGLAVEDEFVGGLESIDG
jgi:hypothetical protein